MSPKEVSVLDMMEARDRRAELQRRMTAAFHVPVISFTMNIAGPVKRTPLIRRGFVLGLRTLRRRLKAAGFPVLHEELLDEFTGCEAFLAVDAGLLAIKALTSDIENSGPLGRLCDMDVISPAGEKAEREMLGLSGRTCLLCGRLDLPACGKPLEEFLQLFRFHRVHYCLPVHDAIAIRCHFILPFILLPQPG